MARLLKTSVVPLFKAKIFRCYAFTATFVKSIFHFQPLDCKTQCNTFTNKAFFVAYEPHILNVNLLMIAQFYALTLDLQSWFLYICVSMVWVDLKIYIVIIIPLITIYSHSPTVANDIRWTPTLIGNRFIPSYAYSFNTCHEFLSVKHGLWFTIYPTSPPRFLLK